MFLRSVMFSVASLLSFSVLATPVNVNTAEPEEIAIALSGVGPAKAQAISSYCREAKCSKAEDLLSVKGIGDKTLEKIRADLRF